MKQAKNRYDQEEINNKRDQVYLLINCFTLDNGGKQYDSNATTLWSTMIMAPMDLRETLTRCVEAIHFAPSSVSCSWL